MAVLAVSALRQRVAAVVSALTSPSQWRESSWAFDAFPADPGRFAHLTFAVGVPQSDFDELEGSRRRLTTGGLTGTDVVVRWVFRLKADGTAIASYDAALDAEAALVKALMAASRTDLHLGVTRLSRRGAGDGEWLLCETALTAVHQYALS